MALLTILGGRGSGKTKLLIEECLKDSKGIILVATVREREKMIKYRGVPADRVVILQLSTLMPDRVMCGDFNLYVDRADTILAQLLKSTIVAIALDAGEVKVV
jgi:hypothetical protein